MRYFTLLLVGILPLIIHAQNTINDLAGKERSVLVGVNFSPDYSYRTIKSDGSTGGNTVLASSKKWGIAKFGFTTGVTFSLHIKNHLRFETGFQYSNKGYKSKMMDFIWAQPDPALAVKGRSIYNINYLDLPAKLNVTFSEKKIRFCAGAGLVVNILIKQSFIMIQYFKNGDIQENNNVVHYNYKKFNISPFLSAGIDYQINNKSNLRVEPTFRYGIFKLMDAPVSEHLWNAGLNITYLFKIK